MELLYQTKSKSQINAISILKHRSSVSIIIRDQRKSWPGTSVMRIFSVILLKNPMVV